MTLEHYYYEKSIQLKEYLSEILNIPLDKIAVYEELDFMDVNTKRIIIQFNKYFYSIRKEYFCEPPTDFIVKDIISRYTTYVMDKLNETNKEQ